MSLQKGELLGAPNPYDNDEESDLDMGIEEDDVESIEIQFNEVEELFKECVQQQKINKRPHVEFEKSLVNELRSAKLTNNISNSDFTSILLDVVLGTIFPSSKKEKEDNEKSLSTKELAA